MEELDDQISAQIQVPRRIQSHEVNGPCPSLPEHKRAGRAPSRLAWVTRYKSQLLYNHLGQHSWARQLRQYIFCNNWTCIWITLYLLTTVISGRNTSVFSILHLQLHKLINFILNVGPCVMLWRLQQEKDRFKTKLRRESARACRVVSRRVQHSGVQKNLYRPALACPSYTYLYCDVDHNGDTLERSRTWLRRRTLHALHWAFVFRMSNNIGPIHLQRRSSKKVYWDSSDRLLNINYGSWFLDLVSVCDSDYFGTVAASARKISLYITDRSNFVRTLLNCTYIGRLFLFTWSVLSIFYTLFKVFELIEPKTK